MGAVLVSVAFLRRVTDSGTFGHALGTTPIFEHFQPKRGPSPGTQRTPVAVIVARRELRPI